MAVPQNRVLRSLPQLLVTPGLLLFVLALLPRLYRLDAQSLWLDEGGTWSEVTGRTGKGWLALLGELWSKDAGYPLYHILLKIWVAVAGDSEWALRFPSALAGAATVAVMYYATCELGRRTKDEGRRTKDEGRRTKDEGRRTKDGRPISQSPSSPVFRSPNL